METRSILCIAAACMVQIGLLSRKFKAISEIKLEIQIYFNWKVMDIQRPLLDMMHEWFVTFKHMHNNGNFSHLIWLSLVSC
jgi:hypothetical protein